MWLVRRHQHGVSTDSAELPVQLPRPPPTSHYRLKVRSTTSRRGFLAALGATTSIVALDACSGSGTSSRAATRGSTSIRRDRRRRVSTGADVAVVYFADLGYPRLSALPLITAQAFNGGLRYDGSVDTEPDKGLWVNPCARVEDASSTRPEVLALFHQLEVHNSSGGLSTEDGLTTSLHLLVDRLGLDPTRLGVISTELLTPLVPVLTDRGIPEDHVLLRRLDQARATRDGSGYFAPEGHPDQPQLYTASTALSDERPAADAVGAPGRSRFGSSSAS